MNIVWQTLSIKGDYRQPNATLKPLVDATRRFRILDSNDCAIIQTSHGLSKLHS